MIPSPWWRTTQARGCWVLLPLNMGVPGAPLGPGCRVSRPAACQTFFLLLHRGDCYREGGHHLPPRGGGGVGGAWVSICAAAQLAWFLRGGGGVRQTNSSEGPPWLTHTQSVCLLARGLCMWCVEPRQPPGTHFSGWGLHMGLLSATAGKWYCWPRLLRGTPLHGWSSALFCVVVISVCSGAVVSVRLLLPFLFFLFFFVCLDFVSRWPPSREAVFLSLAGFLYSIAFIFCFLFLARGCSYPSSLLRVFSLACFYVVYRASPSCMSFAPLSLLSICLYSGCSCFENNIA